METETAKFEMCLEEFHRRAAVNSPVESRHYRYHRNQAYRLEGSSKDATLSGFLKYIGYSILERITR